MVTNNNLLNNEEASGVVLNNYFHEQEASQNKIFSLILVSPNNFNRTEWLESFAEFVNKYHKILYAKISATIITTKDDLIIQNLESNLSNIIESIVIKDGRKKYAKDFEQVEKECYVYFIKFYDHCNLALTQRSVYLRTEQDFKRIAIRTKGSVEKSLKEATENIKKHVLQSEGKIKSLERNITGQLIGLVSIFTTLSFVIFGGISVLDNLLENIKTAPVLNTVFIADLWMLCMINLFAIFVKLLTKLADKDIPNLEFHYKNIDILLVVVLILIIIIFLINQCRLGYPRII